MTEELVALERALKAQIKVLLIVSDTCSEYVLRRNDDDDSINIRMRICRSEVNMTTFKLLVKEIDKTCRLSGYYIDREVSEQNIYRRYIVRHDDLQSLSKEPDRAPLKQEQPGFPVSLWKRFKLAVRFLWTTLACLLTRTTLIIVLFNVISAIICLALLRDLQDLYAQQQADEIPAKMRVGISSG